MEKKCCFAEVQKATDQLILISSLLAEYDEQAFEFTLEDIHALGRLIWNIAENLENWNTQEFDETEMNTSEVPFELRAMKA